MPEYPYNNEASPAERKRVLENDRKVSTYHALAQAAADDLAGGRYGNVTKTTVTGADPRVAVPKQPATSFSNQFRNMPNEPSLGFSVEDQEPTGEPWEVERSRNASTQVGVGDGSTPMSGTTEGRPVTKFVRRF